MVCVAADVQSVVDEACVERLSDRCERDVVASVLEDVGQAVRLVQIVTEYVYAVTLVRFGAEVFADQIKILVEYGLRRRFEADARRFVPCVVSAETDSFEPRGLFDEGLVVDE